MASSVSSEWALSHVGITIMKRCNWLGGDIAEVLQGLKIGIQNDLLVRSQLVTLEEEEEEYSDDGKVADSSMTIELDLDDEAEQGPMAEHVFASD